MIVKVTSRGVTIPRRLLGGAKEAEVHQEGERIVVVPMNRDSPPDDEPLYELGSDPMDFDVTDASVNHDKYLYEDYEFQSVVRQDQTHSVRSIIRDAL